VLIIDMFTGSKTKLHPEATISEVKKASDQSIMPFNNSALNPNVITDRASPNLDKKGQSNALPNPSPAVAINATTRLRE
jgi:hypothetical protein